MANIIKGFRVSKALIKRVTELSNKLETIDELTIFTKVTRSVVIRVAIFYGIQKYEKHYGIAGDCTSLASSFSPDTKPSNKKKIAPDSDHISLSFPEWLIQRAEAVAEIMDNDEEMNQFGNISRSHVLRLSLSEGAILLAQKYLPKTGATGIEGASGV